MDDICPRRATGLVGVRYGQSENKVLHVALGNLKDNVVFVSDPGYSVDVVFGSDGETLVRDHGAGIPAAIRESIFEPINKEPPNRKGRGPGLAMVMAIVNLHRGDIRVEATARGCATFVMKV